LGWKFLQDSETCVCTDAKNIGLFVPYDRGLHNHLFRDDDHDDDDDDEICYFIYLKNDKGPKPLTWVTIGKQYHASSMQSWPLTLDDLEIKQG